MPDFSNDLQRLLVMDSGEFPKTGTLVYQPTRCIYSVCCLQINLWNLCTEILTKLLVALHRAQLHNGTYTFNQGDLFIQVSASAPTEFQKWKSLEI